jgi:hypothetical protein
MRARPMKIFVFVARALPVNFSRTDAMCHPASTIAALRLLHIEEQRE